MHLIMQRLMTEAVQCNMDNSIDTQTTNQSGTSVNSNHIVSQKNWTHILCLITPTIIKF